MKGIFLDFKCTSHKLIRKSSSITGRGGGGGLQNEKGEGGSDVFPYNKGGQEKF